MPRPCGRYFLISAVSLRVTLCHDVAIHTGGPRNRQSRHAAMYFMLAAYIRGIVGGIECLEHGVRIGACGRRHIRALRALRGQRDCKGRKEKPGSRRKHGLFSYQGEIYSRANETKSYRSISSPLYGEKGRPRLHFQQDEYDDEKACTDSASLRGCGRLRDGTECVRPGQRHAPRGGRDAGSSSSRRQHRRRRG